MFHGIDPLLRYGLVQRAHACGRALTVLGGGTSLIWYVEFVLAESRTWPSGMLVRVGVKDMAV